MECSHAKTCPLYPHLRGAVDGWRTRYCHSEDAWKSCARYELSLQGEPVPLALLPNGATIGTLALKEEETESARVYKARKQQIADMRVTTQRERKPGPWARIMNALGVKRA